MSKRKQMLLADAVLIVVAACWGGGFVAGDIAVDQFEPFFILAVRFLGAALLAGLLFFPAIRRCGKKEAVAGAILGLILFVIYPLQTVALRYTLASKQAFLVTAHVAVTPFVSWWLLKRRPEGKSFFVGLLMLTGIGILCLDRAFTIQWGDLLSLGFALGYSLIVVLTGKFSKAVNALGMSFWQYLTTGALSLAAALLFEPAPTGFNGSGLWSLAYLVVVNTVLAYTLQNVAQRYTSDTHASILISLESVFGYLISVVFFGDPFTARVLVGGVVVFAAVLLSEVELPSRSERKPCC